VDLNQPESKEPDLHHEMQSVLHLIASNDNIAAYGSTPILAGADKGCLGTAPGCMACRGWRVGKIYLSQRLPDIEYFDCELPRIRWMLEDPPFFLAGLDNRTVVLDEIHGLPNPWELLKIAADHFPAMKVLATGSSTLGASAKFWDTLAGRKAELKLTPMIFVDPLLLSPHTSAPVVCRRPFSSWPCRVSVAL